MRKIFLIAMIACTAGILQAQQDAQYTNFMFNKLALNPAYAGSQDVASIFAIYRNQWTGMPGAPNTQVLGFHAPVASGRMGLGALFERDEIGFTESWRGSASYAYRFTVGKGKLALGVSGTVRYFGVDWSQVDPTDINDSQLPVGNQGKYRPNFGAGVFYNTERWYAGVSMPHLLNGNLDFTPTVNQGSTKFSRERRHCYVMGGLALPLNDQVVFAPNLLLKYVQNAPFDADINASFIFGNFFMVGATYRVGDGVNALINFNIKRRYRIGVGYDYALTALQNYQNGSFEAFLGYEFNYRSKGDVLNPRFFW